MQYEQTMPPKGSRYKTKVNRVSPLNQRNMFSDHAQCFLGVSLDNAQFKPQKVDSMFDWISARFKHCTILIGDSIHRLNLMTQHGITEPEGLALAKKLWAIFIENADRMLHQRNLTTEYKFITCSSIQNSQAYFKYHRDLQAFYDNNSAFYDSVRSFAIKYHRVCSRSNKESFYEEKIKLSVKYFLEEFSIFACLYDQGLPVMLYPGSFSTLEEITEGIHPGAPLALKKLTIVSLCFKGRGKMR